MTICLRLSSLLLLLILLTDSAAWVFPASKLSRATSRAEPTTKLFEAGNNVGTISLASLTDHEKEGTLLAKSIAKWLDFEVSQSMLRQGV